MVRWCRIVVFLLLAFAPVRSSAEAGAGRDVRSELSLATEDARLLECFEWAKGQALAYARTGGRVPGGAP